VDTTRRRVVTVAASCAPRVAGSADFFSRSAKNQGEKSGLRRRLGRRELFAHAFLDRLVRLWVAFLELALRGHDPLVALGVELLDGLRRRLGGGREGDQQGQRKPASGEKRHLWTPNIALCARPARKTEATFQDTRQDPWRSVASCRNSRRPRAPPPPPAVFGVLTRNRAGCAAP